VAKRARLIKRSNVDIPETQVVGCIWYTTQEFGTILPAQAVSVSFRKLAITVYIYIYMYRKSVIGNGLSREAIHRHEKCTPNVHCFLSGVRSGTSPHHIEVNKPCVSAKRYRTNFTRHYKVERQKKKSLFTVFIPNR